MIELENYKSNLEVQDKYDLKTKNIDKGKVYAGNTEYINPQIKAIEHNSPLLAAAVIGLDNTGAPLPENPKFFDTWTDIDAQEVHLNTKPTCYVIIGQPGLGAFNLGEAMAAKYNVIHLCPKNILNDEVEQKSSTGKTWEFNMRQNKVCCYDMMLAMLKIKLNSEVVQHRGYVISGIPFVTCCKKHLCYIDTLYSEEAFMEIDDLLFETIRNLKKKKKKPPPVPGSTHSSVISILAVNAGEEGAEEEEEENQEEEQNPEEEEDIPAELPKYLLDACSDVIVKRKPRCDSKLAMILNQLHELFNLTLKPDFIINITCPDLDIVKVRSHIYINYKTGLYVCKPFETNYVPEQSWPRKCRIDGYIDPFASNVFNPKYNCKAPSNYDEKIMDELCNYKSNVIPYLEKKFQDFDPKMIIEVDGRRSTNEMLHQISETLILMQTHPVIIPKPLFLEESPDDLEEFWESVGELDVVNSGVVNFKYSASPWYNRCPVEQKLRRSVVGKAKFAVMFFKHVYLMSSLNFFISFYKNPRPYLKLKYLEPNCRVIVIGTKSSGKTMISQCLSWIFDAPILCYKTILQTEREKKYYLTSLTILSEIIATIEDARYLQWQATEEKRKANLNAWCNYAQELLKNYLVLLIQRMNFYKVRAENILKKQLERIERKKRLHELKQEQEEEEEEEEEDKSVEEIEEEFDPVLQTQLGSLETKLSFLPISLLNSKEECETALKDQNILEYAPIELLTVTDKPTIPVIGEDDVTAAITLYIETNELQKDLEPTTEELMTVIVKLLTDIDTHHQENTQSEQLYGKYILDDFPSDPEYWEYLDDQLFPDYTIALIENREIDEELFQHYSSSDASSKRFDEKILLAKDPLIHTKLQATKYSSLQDIYLDIKKIVDNHLNNTLDLMFITEKESQLVDDENFQAQFITSFNEAIEKFRENWDSLKIKIDEKSKSYIEAELENKTSVDIIEEVLHQLRKCYSAGGREMDEDEQDDANEDENGTGSIDLLTYNDPRFLCETNIYCPIAYYDHHVLWEGKPEFSYKYNDKIHYFCKEEFVELFKNNIFKYQFYNIPYKKIPKLKICIIGSIGSGATSLSKYLAKELGLLHIDFANIVNEYLVPKHFKKIGRQHENIFTDGPIEEEGVVDFQMDEENVNLISDILGNERELKRMFYEYFERGTPVLSKLMQILLKKIWFNSNSPIGFVLDGYPKISNDVEDMMECFAIPDIVIDLENDVETATERIAPIMFKTWKSQLIEAKKVAAVKLSNERQQWLDFLTKEIVIKLVIEELFENMVFLLPEPAASDSVASTMIDAHPSGSVNLDPNLFKLYNEMVEEHPEPKDTNEWEKPEDVRERIDGRIEGIFETYEEGIESVKELLMEQRIKTVSVKATQPFNKVTRSALSKLKNLRNRCESLFEQTFIVSIDIAEVLLLRGFYFYSKFYRLCPVYVFENPKSLQNPYKTSINKGTLFPVVHRTHIYFISSAASVIKFRTNPLKYITCDAIKTHYEYPLRIGVIGPPKSGQSTLAARLAKQYGLLCISPGSAIRNVLKNLHWTKLATDMLTSLRKGHTIEDHHIVKAMRMTAIDYRTVTSGYVLDGAPLSPCRAIGHGKACLFPNIIFDICSNKCKILENSQNEIHYDILKYMPPYSYGFIELRYEHWEKKQHRVRNWIAEDYQNLCVLDGSLSQWHVLQQANDHLSVLTSKIYHYIDNVDKKIVPAIMISNETFQARQSQYKSMCPVCFHKKVYNRMSSHIRGKTGVVQYQKTFYWICDEHMDMVMAFPHRYLNAIDVKIPEIPALINIVNLEYVYENGICIVSYAENLPGQVLKIGTNQYAASYDGKNYLFCSKVCLSKFVSKPYLYKDITIFKSPKSFPKLSLKNLPSLGYLEQILGNILTEACCSVNAFRPKYPGLSFQTSALIYIGLYLKTHNPLMDKNKMPMYSKAFRIFEARCKLLLNIGLRLRSMDNPFAAYPKCVHRKPKLNPADDEQENLCSSQIQETSDNIPKRTSNYVQLHKPSYRRKLNKPRRVPVPDERFDYLCEFHKPVSKVPAFLNVVDIAGLVKGAAEGQGLGNAFLSHIKACDAIFNLCRAFDDEDVIHVDGEVNPVRDLETIGEELRLKDEEQLVQNFEKLDKLVNRGGDKKLKSEYDSLSKIKAVLVDEKKHIRFGDWSAADIEVLNKYLFLTSKPALYLVNLSEKDYIRKKNKWLPKLKEWIDKNDPGAPLIPFSGALEMKLFDMEPAERQAFLKEHNLTSALDKIIVQGYKALQLEYFFTAGPDEVKAWTIQKGTKAPQAAGRIHTDFEKGFIMAEVMHYKDFKEEGTEAACKAAGKYRQQGRNYMVEDGDIIFFKFNAGAGLKDPKKK